MRSLITYVVSRHGGCRSWIRSKNKYTESRHGGSQVSGYVGIEGDCPGGSPKKSTLKTKFPADPRKDFACKGCGMWDVGSRAHRIDRASIS